MKKVLVTGGSGYIGARLCLHLANEGYAVTPFCYSNIPKDETWISKMDDIIVGDVRDEEILVKLAENHYDVVIHLVSLDHSHSNGSPSYVSSVNIAPVWSLLDIFSKHGSRKFVYLSTVQVYGALKSETISEFCQTKTQNAYSLTHDIGEVICEHYNRVSKIDCRIIRLSNSYGAPVFKENNCWWLVINDLCRMAYRQNEIVLQSDGTPLRDFIHGWDVCRGIQTIIETNQKHSVYNLCSGVTLSIMEIAKKIKVVFLERYGVEISITTVNPGSILDINKYLLDNSRIKSIGFEPKWSLEMGINGVFDFLEQDDE